MQELLKHFHELSLHPKNAKELKDLILQLAIQGKLTADWRAQNSALITGKNSAKNLLERIKAEKAKLIKENLLAGKTRKTNGEKALPSITKGEIPFQIPETWCWCRFGEIVEILNGKAYKKAELLEDDNLTPVLRVGNLFTSKKWYYSDLNLEEDKYIEEGDLIYAWSASFGPFIWNGPKAIYHYHIWKINHSSDISKEYLHYFLLSETAKIKASGHGISMVHMTKGKMEKLLTRFPPVAEQKAIVKTVESLFKEVEALENLTEKRIELKRDYGTSALSQLVKKNSKTEWQTLKPQFHEFFDEVDNIKKLRETILQLAVQGKLTAKWRSENPELISGNNGAEILFKEIKAEKAKLIKEKKIKKDKALPPISEDEIPYELPDGWIWCRFQEIFDIRDGTHDSPKDSNDSITYPLITSKNFKNGEIDFESARRISEKDYLKVIQRSKVDKGDILFSMIGGNIGNQVEVREFTEYAIKNVALFKHYRLGLPAYGFLKIYSLFIAMTLQNDAAGGAQPFVSLKFLRNLIVGLPTMKEQRLIIQKVDSLMKLCDQLEKEVENSQKQIEGLMQSVLKEVFEGEAIEEEGAVMAAEPERVYEKSNK